MQLLKLCAVQNRFPLRVPVKFDRKSFHKDNKSNFKKYFRLTIDDKPVSPFRKAYEVWKTNPSIRKMKLGFKWILAIGFLLYF